MAINIDQGVQPAVGVVTGPCVPARLTLFVFHTVVLSTHGQTHIRDSPLLSAQWDLSTGHKSDFSCSMKSTVDLA